jgi:transcriptional regulator with XRE-family HTH domain
MAAEKEPVRELGRRVAMARAYRGLHQTAVAERFGIEPQTLGRYEKGDIPEHRMPWLTDRSIEVFELPEEFFDPEVDFSRLALMVETWRQAKRLPDPAELPHLIDQVLNEMPRGG